MIQIDFNEPRGNIKALHGVDNAPMRLNGEQPEFKAAGIPYMRTHDTAGAWGGTHFADIPNIFPDFDADENDPASYDFAFTDAYLKPLAEAGTEPFYRLGVTIENYHAIKAYNIYPPKDFGKWARICEHVIRHYNEGWADGFHWHIRYWEIWNEPENPPMWKGTREQFFELYRIAACHLKQCFPEISVGGYGGCGFYAIDGTNTTDFFKSFVTWFEDFCAFVKAENIPFDFYSWHLYTCDPRQIIVHAEYVRKTLDSYGFQHTESIFNEWNFINLWKHSDACPFEEMKELPGAAFTASAFCLMQKGPVDKAMYYDALPTRSYCGLFYFPSCRVTPCYYSFKAFNTLYELGTEADAISDDEEIYVCAARNDSGEKAFMIVNNNDEARAAAVTLNGADIREFRQFRLDSEHKSLTETEKACSGDLSLPPKSVVLFTLKNDDGNSEVKNGTQNGNFAGIDTRGGKK